MPIASVSVRRVTTVAVLVPAGHRTGQIVRRLATAFCVLLAACGGDSTSQPPGSGGGAVTLAVRAGDGQQAAPGTAVAAAPVVVATNAAGQPQPGVVVTFAIDSGAGTVATAQATTAADGTASPGRWTLGAAEGVNVLRVSAAGANTLRFRAVAVLASTPLLTDVAVPVTGGTLKVTVPGNPFDGLTLAVPAAAYDSPAVFSIAARTSAPPTLPAGYAQVGQALVITTAQAFATLPMVLTIPVSVASPDTALAAFFVDQATGALEPVPVAARTATTLSVFSRHFTQDRLLKRQGAPRVTPKVAGNVPPLATAGFSPVILIVVSVPVARLNALTATGFLPGRDDWEFANYGTILAPAGACAGMSISAMYYYYALRDGGPLNGRYNTVTTEPHRHDTNTGGMRLASVVQKDADQSVILTWERVVNGFAALTMVPRARLYYQSLVMAMQVTRMPQLVAIFGDSVGHAVVAYGSENGVVSFADPNEPGTARTMTFASDAFVPFPFKSSGSRPSKTIRRVEPLGASAMIDDAALAAGWAQVPDASIGRSRFPQTRLQRWDSFADTYADIDTSQAVLVTAEQEFRVRTKCRTGCDLAYMPDTLINTRIISTAGVLLHDGDEGDASVTLMRGVQRLGIIESAISPLDTATTWSRFRWISVNYQPVLLEPVRPLIRVDSTLRFTVTATDLAPLVTRYAWSFSDGTPAVNTTTPSVSHKYTAAGDYVARVVLHDARGTILGRDTTVVSVGTLPLVGWALRTVTVQAATLPAGGIGTERSDTLAYNFATAVMSRMTGAPANTALFVGGVAVTGPSCNAGAILQQAPPGVTPADSLVSAHFVGLLGTCGDPDFTGTLVMGPLGAGTVVGSAAAVFNPDLIVVPGGSIAATMTGKALAGTFVWNVRYSTGLGTYTVAFTAVQVRPK
ncbi:MAG: PKD domain-containing protein [Gemmatimonadaceae bacterium]|nr:PKD domain-containing protein [Gemmatimonadaceae bacterium]